MSTKDYNAQSIKALDDILFSLNGLADEVSHHVANIDDDAEGDDYCRAIIEELIETAETIRFMSGIKVD